MNLGQGSHDPHQQLTTAALRNYEDRLDWLENQVFARDLSPQQLTLLLQLAVTLIGIALFFAFLRTTRIAA